ncbi:MAG TPA: GAF domain-containing sensor histidine kinase, partial [Thermoanaerobaculia bacterium]|nr:GAF domain-containing sensor histidine kinase [Thermoanaerobaculia bacterium]
AVARRPKNRFQMTGLLGLTSPVRTAVVIVGAVALADVVSIIIVDRLRPTSFWLFTVLDTAIMACLTIPVLWLLIFRPLNRLFEERRLAEERLRRRSLDLEALYGVSSAATGDLDPDRLLTRVLDVVLPAFGAEAGWIQVLGGGPAGASRFVAARGVEESLVRFGPSGPRGACATCRAWCAAASASDQPAEIAECERPLGEALRAAGFRQHRAVLLSAGEKAGAILNLLWPVPRPCGEAEASLLRGIGRQVDIALQNAALFTAEQSARQQADTLRSASLAITHSLDLEAVFAALLDHLDRLVPCDRAKVMLFESSSRLKVRALFTRAGVLDFPATPMDSFDVDANPTVREVLSSRRSICIANTFELPGWAERGRSDVEQSWLGMPLLAGGEAIGLFTLVKAEPGFFTPERVHLVEALAGPASVAIANARLFEEVRSGREQIKKVTRKLVEAQENERRRIARELHDEAGQLLSSLMLGLRLLEHEAANPVAVTAHARELKHVAEMAQEGLHRLASDLRPAALDHVGLVPALGQLAAKFSGTEGPVVRLETLGFDGMRLSPDLDIVLYRIAQEALSNVLRHSGARAVSVVLERRDKGIILVVEDDGRGFDVAAANRSDRLGLPGIRERAEMLGGTLLLESSPGSGTTLVVEIPHAD